MNTALSTNSKLVALAPSVFASSWWGTVPLALVALVAVIILSQQIGWLRTGRRAEGDAKPGAVPTYLRLQFNPSPQHPVEMGLENIWRWYVFNHGRTSVQVGGQTMIVGKMAWTVTLIFDRPVAYKQILIESPGATLPVHEVKDASPRHAIIYFSDDIGGRVLEFRAVVA